MTEGTTRRWRRSIAPFLPGLAHTAALALTCNLVLELSRMAGVQGNPWQFKNVAFPAMFLLGSLVLWLLIGLLHAVVGRLWLTTALTGAATALIAVADHEKVQFRREPLYPSDWRFVGDVGFLKDMVGFKAVLVLVVAAVATVAVAFAVAGAARRRVAERALSPVPVPRRTRIVVRLGTGLSCLLAVAYLAGFNSPGNAARGAYDVLGASWRSWSQQRNYLGNGFVGGFLYNLDVPTMARPKDYGPAQMARITATYTAAAQRINRTRDPGALDDLNVVMILSESFSDPEALRGVRVAEDPIPFTRRLMGSTTSGQMLAQGVGGGTANMEFEALTGMSLSQFPPHQVPYQMLIPDQPSFPSAVGSLRSSGHRAVAIHPFTTEMYRRREVYPVLGFQDFVYDRTMHERRRLGHQGYISDASAFGEVERRLTEEQSPLFLHLVTMQNHMPYGGRYDDPVDVEGPDGARLTEISQYVRGLEYSDEALRGLIERLRRFEEKTIVVFYGDHLPADYPDSVFQANPRRTMHQTPFFVWANFPGPRRELPTTSPIYFLDLLLERAGATVSPYTALLHELRAELPAMDSGILVDDDDRTIRPAAVSERAKRLLHDYRLVQYDLAVGQRYSADGMLRVP